MPSCQAGDRRWAITVEKRRILSFSYDTISRSYLVSHDMMGDMIYQQLALSFLILILMYHLIYLMIYQDSGCRYPPLTPAETAETNYHFHVTPSPRLMQFPKPTGTIQRQKHIPGTSKYVIVSSIFFEIIHTNSYILVLHSPWFLVLVYCVFRIIYVVSCT